MKKINIDEEENNLLKFEFAMPSVQSLPNVGFGLSSLEIERTRIFAIHNPMSNQYGTISDVNWLINYKSDGSGHWNLSFTQNVKWVLTRGSTTVSITDAANTVISTFDVVFFRTCGGSGVTFSSLITPDVCERACGLQLEVDGYGRFC